MSSTSIAYGGGEHAVALQFSEEETTTAIVASAARKSENRRSAGGSGSRWVMSFLSRRRSATSKALQGVEEGSSESSHRNTQRPPGSVAPASAWRLSREKTIGFGRAERRRSGNDSAKQGVNDGGRAGSPVPGHHDGPSDPGSGMDDGDGVALRFTEDEILEMEKSWAVARQRRSEPSSE